MTVELPKLKAAEGFHYSSAPQRTQPWFDLRIGKRTASRLEDWLSVSKAKASLGQPLKKRLDYEKELVYEQTFGVSYQNFVSEAMEDGINLERYAIEQYSKVTGNVVEEVGAWYSEYFVASPDGAVSEDGLVEAKVVRDNTFSDILVGSMVKDKETKELVHVPALSENGVLAKHWKQVQGGLWASGRKWCDYIAINTNTKKIKVIRIEADSEFHKWLELAIPEDFTVNSSLFETEGLYDLVDPVPDPQAETNSSGNYFS